MLKNTTLEELRKITLNDILTNYETLEKAVRIQGDNSYCGLEKTPEEENELNRLDDLLIEYYDILDLENYDIIYGNGV